MCRTPLKGATSGREGCIKKTTHPYVIFFTSFICGLGANTILSAFFLEVKKGLYYWTNISELVYYLKYILKRKTSTDKKKLVKIKKNSKDIDIQLTGITPPHICSCPKTGPGFPTSFVVPVFGFFCVQRIKLEGDCSFCCCRVNC